MWTAALSWISSVLQGLFLAAYKAASLIFLALWRGEKGRRKVAEHVLGIRDEQLKIANRVKLRRDELLRRMRKRKRS